MQTWIGTSGWNYDAWKGHFYPEDLPKAKRLTYYAERFSSVEINSTFYRIPDATTFERWSAETPPKVRFAVKASQRITHRARLREAGDTVTFFAERARVLGDKLGPVLYQLPPNLKKDVPRLQAFLSQLPAEQSAAFEFRHESWFDDELSAALSTAGAALCVADSDDLEVPLVATASFGYLRLRKADYDSRALDRWATQIQNAGWSEVFVYFKHEDEARGTRLAEDLRTRLGGTAPGA